MADYSMKLTDQKVKDMRLLITEGWSRDAIKTYFGISERTYSDVANRRSWTDVDDYPDGYLSRPRKGRKTTYSALDVVKLRELAVLNKLGESEITVYADLYGVTADTIKGAVWGYQQKWIPGAVRNSANRRDLEQMFRYHPASPTSFNEGQPAEDIKKLTRKELLTRMPEFIEKNMSNAEIAAATHSDYPTVKKMTTICRKAKAQDFAWFDKMRQGRSYAPWMLDAALSLFDSQNKSVPLPDQAEHINDEVNADTTRTIAKALSELITSAERTINAMRILIDTLTE